MNEHNRGKQFEREVPTVSIETSYFGPSRNTLGEGALANDLVQKNQTINTKQF